MNIKDFILGYVIGKNDGGGGASIEPLEVTENGEYSEEGVAYSPVTVNVSGGGGGDVATGTITFTAQQNTAPGSGLEVGVTHNLGKTPTGFAWMIESTDATNLNNKQIQTGYAIVGELVTASNYVSAMSHNSSNSMYGWVYTGTTAQSMFNSANGNSTTINILYNNINRYDGKIPANTTIRWFVW